MLRLGGSLEYTDAGGGVYGTGASSKYSAPLLTSTRYIGQGDSAGANVAAAFSASHQDDMNSYLVRRSDDAGATMVGGVIVAGANYTWVRWDSDSPNGRGTVDLNAGFADLSVQRFDRVRWDPRNEVDRMARVPAFSNEASFPAGWWEIVPKP